MDAQNLEAQVLEEFYALTRIPRPSGQEAAVGQYLTGRLRKEGLQPETDAAGNIRCDVPGTSGLETAPRMILQAHMDMVCVGTPDYHPETDAVQTQLRDGYLCTDGRSSLGADCGIGLAAALYAATGETHCPLRLIFTVDEERGLIGAKAIQRDWLEDCGGLINLDGFHFGQLMISSAGGCRQTFTRIPECFPPMLEMPVKLSITGLLGGHSGDDIGSGRANAAELMILLLHALELPFELSRIWAGTAHNAICSEAEALLVVDSRDMWELLQTAEQFLQESRALYPLETGLHIALYPAQMPGTVFTADEKDQLLAMAALVPCGVREQHPLVPKVVGTSGNLGLIHGDAAGIEVRSFMRSYSNETMEQQAQMLDFLAEGLGYSAAREGYPAWPGVEKDPLTDMFIEEGSKMGLSLQKNAVHVGLETSCFHALSPEMPMVSTGMDVENPHSVHERVRLETIAPFTRLLCRVLQHTT